MSKQLDKISGQPPTKILVLQLARLGDIYQTWPVLRALKRQHPNAELHFLTRSRFQAAAPSDGCLDRLWTLDTRHVMEPLVDEKPDLNLSMDRLDGFADDLKKQNFDLVMNLSFSPFSSYLTKRIAGESCEVRGYSRFEDGYLSIPDDGSAYFYAQTGPEKANRIHVTDLFSIVAGVELCDEDWDAGDNNLEAYASPVVRSIGANAVVVHLGASDLSKTLSSSKWMQVVKSLIANTTNPIVLVGSREEREISERVASVSGSRSPMNLVGQTTLSELFEIVREARLVIGGDSAPVQIASITNTPVLNISFPMVSAWETGPRAAASRIIVVKDENQVTSDAIAMEAKAMLEGRPPTMSVLRVPGRTLPYLETEPLEKSFDWELLKAVYMGGTFPPPPSDLFALGMKRLSEVNDLALEQVQVLKTSNANKTAAAILDRVDELMEQIMKMVPETGVIIRWFRVERLRIGPMPIADIVATTEAVHRRLADVLNLYLGSAETTCETELSEGESSDDIAMG